MQTVYHPYNAFSILYYYAYRRILKLDFIIIMYSVILKHKNKVLTLFASTGRNPPKSAPSIGKLLRYVMSKYKTMIKF